MHLTIMGEAETVAEMIAALVKQGLTFTAVTADGCTKITFTGGF